MIAKRIQTQVKESKGNKYKYAVGKNLRRLREHVVRESRDADSDAMVQAYGAKTNVARWDQNEPGVSSGLRLSQFSQHLSHSSQHLSQLSQHLSQSSQHLSCSCSFWTHSVHWQAVSSVQEPGMFGWIARAADGLLLLAIPVSRAAMSSGFLGMGVVETCHLVSRDLEVFEAKEPSFVSFSQVHIGPGYEFLGDPL